jgi:hypothetical protein
MRALILATLTSLPSGASALKRQHLITIVGSLVGRNGVLGARPLSLPREQQEIAVWITHDECLRAPRLGSKRLNDLDARLLIFEEERLRILYRDRDAEQLFCGAPGSAATSVGMAKIVVWVWARIHHLRSCSL